MEIHGNIHVYHHHEQDDRIIVFLLNKVLNQQDTILEILAEEGTEKERKELSKKLDALIKDVKSTIK